MWFKKKHLHSKFLILFPQVTVLTGLFTIIQNMPKKFIQSCENASTLFALKTIFSSCLGHAVRKNKFSWTWMSNQFWVVIERCPIFTFIIIVLFKSFPALSRIFIFYHCLEVLKVPSEEYQHVFFVLWLYHLVLIYFHVHCSTNILCLSPNFNLLVSLWVHCAFKLYIAYFCWIHVLTDIFCFKPFLITWIMKFTFSLQLAEISRKLYWIMNF